jgi:hypothetical protein
MDLRRRLQLGLALLVALGGCAPGTGSSAPRTSGGYSEPGHTEAFWILDVEGNRLMIEANWSPDSPRKDVAEMRAILDSIRIEP